MFNILSLLLLALTFFIRPSAVQAFKATTFVTFSNPVTGYEGWENSKQTPLDLPRFIYEESTPSALPITWLLRYDAIESSTISAYFANLVSADKNQSLGLFLTITPNLVNSLGIPYPPGFSEHNANRVFLSGYQDEQRKLIIDRYMSLFFEKFGFEIKYPPSWRVSAYENDLIAPKLIGLSPLKQEEVDMWLVKADGTENKSKLGGNATTAISMALAKAGAKTKGIPLYQYFGSLIGNTQFQLPTPQFLVMEGGKHGNWATDIQEFMIIPNNKKSFAIFKSCFPFCVV